MTEFVDDLFTKLTRVLDLGYKISENEEKFRELFEKNDDRAMSFFNTVGQSASSKQYFILGFCYKLGIGTLQDDHRAFGNWKKDNTSYGQYIIGICYEKGWSVVRDFN